MESILSARESKSLEFKEQPPHFSSLIKTCIAFSNGAGGRIIIGIQDETHAIVGVNDEDTRRLYDDFPNSLYDSAHPNIFIQIYEQWHDGKRLVIIDVPPSSRKPYFFKKSGMAKGTYVRVGSSTRIATPQYIEDLIREAERVSYDEEIIHAPISILSKELLYAYFNANFTVKRLLSERIVKTKPANQEMYAPTVAGVLMFHENPEHYIPEAQIKLTHFKGNEGRDILRTEDISGTLEQQFAQCMKLLDYWLSTHYDLVGGKLIGKLKLPPEALREAILNALLHRKYSVPGSIKIALYDKRLEIFSPGGFPGLVDINNLGDGTTFLRNPVLVRLAYKMKLIETRGTGIRLINESCQQAGLKAPEYFEDGDFVKVVLYFEPDATQHQTDEDAILALLKTNGKLSASDIARYLKTSHNTAIRKLNNLIKQGHVRKFGKGPSVTYTYQI